MKGIINAAKNKNKFNQIYEQISNNPKAYAHIIPEQVRTQYYAVFIEKKTKELEKPTCANTNTTGFVPKNSIQPTNGNTATTDPVPKNSTQSSIVDNANTNQKKIETISKEYVANIVNRLLKGQADAKPIDIPSVVDQKATSTQAIDIPSVVDTKATPIQTLTKPMDTKLPEKASTVTDAVAATTAILEGQPASKSIASLSAEKVTEATLLSDEEFLAELNSSAFSIINNPDEKKKFLEKFNCPEAILVAVKPYPKQVYGDGTEVPDIETKHVYVGILIDNQFVVFATLTHSDGLTYHEKEVRILKENYEKQRKEFDDKNAEYNKEQIVFEKKEKEGKSTQAEKFAFDTKATELNEIKKKMNEASKLLEEKKNNPPITFSLGKQDYSGKQEEQYFRFIKNPVIPKNAHIDNIGEIHISASEYINQEDAFRLIIKNLKEKQHRESVFQYRSTSVAEADRPNSVNPTKLKKFLEQIAEPGSVQFERARLLTRDSFNFAPALMDDCPDGTCIITSTKIIDRIIKAELNIEEDKKIQEENLSNLAELPYKQAEPDSSVKSNSAETQPEPAQSVSITTDQLSQSIAIPPMQTNTEVTPSVNSNTSETQADLSIQTQATPISEEERAKRAEIVSGFSELPFNCNDD